jgi:putative ABC transport system ATP-binding protein
MTAILRLEDVRKRREAGGRIFELVVPRLVVTRGQFVAITGPSGSGKSTLLDMLGMVLRPTQAGTFMFTPPDGTQSPFAVVELWEDDQDRLADLRRIYLGYVLQSGGLLPFLTVSQNIGLSRALVGRPWTTREVEAELQELGLQGQAHQWPSSLSGGERQRVAIIRALFHGPSMVLADEPTAAVDRARARAIVVDLFKRSRERGVTVLMVTHDHVLLDGIADHWISLVPDEQGDRDWVRYRCQEGRMAA